MTDEEKAEEYSDNLDLVKERNPELKTNDDFIKQAYLDGLAEGRKEKWHDLREDPNDLPKHSGEYWSKWEDGTYSTVHYFSDSGFGSYVIAWCELPKFKE